ncbi:hypothetical protein [Streptomyces virginiae]|uniref:hypothetical protein n=1 Tax=Streptomyces virginiae TaxID=1961 RepID=UPI0036DFBF1F
MLVRARPEGVLLQSRRGTDLTPAFPEIAEAAAVLGDTTVLDGEVVIYHSGRLAFAALQQRLHRTSRTGAVLLLPSPPTSWPSTERVQKSMVSGRTAGLLVIGQSSS